MELELLRSCLNSQSEAEAGGVKFVYMDDNTVYRFENNRMKKVSKSLINRAKQTDNNQKQTKTKTKAKKQIKHIEQDSEENEQDEEQDDNDDSEEITTKSVKKQIKNKQMKIEQDSDDEIAITKPIKKTVKKVKRSDLIPDNNITGTIDLNEYYNNKNKMEFMTREMERMNNKITKLKQYKIMFNRLNGSEYDQIPDNTPPKNNIDNNSMSSGNEYKQVNDSLFIY